jgi:hypothetical protein
MPVLQRADGKVHIGSVFEAGPDGSAVRDGVGAVDGRRQDDRVETEVGGICDFLLECYFAVVPDPVVG